jgi:hypothetical protein
MRRRVLASVVFAFSVLVFTRPIFAEDNVEKALVARWRFEGNGKDSSGHGHDLKIENPKFDMISGKARGLKFDGICRTVARLPNAIPELNFEDRDFTIHVIVVLEDNSENYQTQTLIENFASSNGPGWSFELNKINNEEYHWTFHSRDNKALSYAGKPNELLTKLSLIVSRYGGKTRIFANGKQVAEETCGSISKSGSPLLIGRRIDEQQKHCCKGVMFLAEIYSAGCDLETVATIDGRHTAGR